MQGTRRTVFVRSRVSAYIRKPMYLLPTMNTQEYLEKLDTKFTEIEEISGTREDCIESLIAEITIDLKEFREESIIAINNQRDVIVSLRRNVLILSAITIITLLITLF